MSEVIQSCLTFCDSIDCSPPGSSIHGIFQARYWSGLPFPSPGDLPDPGIEPGAPALQADSLPSEPRGKPLDALGKSLVSAQVFYYIACATPTLCDNSLCFFIK